MFTCFVSVQTRMRPVFVYWVAYVVVRDANCVQGPVKQSTDLRTAYSSNIILVLSLIRGYSVTGETRDCN